LSKCRNAPADVKRQLRQEAFFGCAMCGNPLLENAHIIKFSISKQFPVEDMVSLCPDCHTEADQGDYPEEAYRRAKQNPFNKDKSKVGKKFMVSSKDMIVNIGSNRFINTETILRVNDFDLISIKRVDDFFLSLDVNLFDKYQNWIALINENYWLVDRNYFWDIEYKAQHLILRNAPRDITFEIQITNEEVFIRGKMYFNGSLIDITPSHVKIGQFMIAGMTMRNAGVGIKQQV